MTVDIAKEARLAQQGDREAFVRLIRQFERSFYRVAKAIVKKDEDCADVIQETILRAYQSIEKVKEPQYIKTWMIRILIHECQRMLRNRKKVFPLVSRQASTLSQEPNWEALTLREAVDKLEEPYRLVVMLHYFEELTVKEIAEVMEIPEGTVKSRLYRARQDLQAALYPQEGAINGE
ncbi:sigma-70 family RNA polymerase sigma factor [Laceyella putida]|uniref:Sigma-70 family RNA polymerase sigma factor n=1 Tax=Laceyella putida TaxID=110101 RepID=A0ABW2RG35_9BACL